MATIGQGINKTVVLAKQSAKGTPASTGGTLLRRITSVFSAERDTFENNEIVSHQQSTGVSYGLKKVSGKLSGLLSAGSYSALMGSLLRADFATGVTTGAITTIAAATTSGAAGTLTRSAGASFLTLGFKIFDIIRVSGFATTGATNNSKNMLVTGVTATVLTVLRLDGTAVGAKAEGDTVTIAVTGKKSVAPLTAHTTDFYTLEEWYSDISKSELFTDLQPSQADVGLPATGNATLSVDMMGLNRTRAGTQVLASPTAASQTSVVNASNGLLYANGAVIGQITGAQLTISGNVQQGDAVVGSNYAAGNARGRITAKGQFSCLMDADAITLQDLYDAETPISLLLLVQDNPGVGTSDFVSFNMGRIKLTGDAPDDGEKNIIRTFPFVAELNSAGGAALANDNTILSIQDSAAS